MATWIHFLLFFNFALCVLSARSIQDQAKQNLSTIEIINSLPANSEPWKVVEKDTYYYAAEWKQYFSSWYGFEVPRDENHGTVYSLMKEDGIYLSWDKANWVLQNTWIIF
ncbi:hypothetical protein NC651_029035 [Populus alba x Populus x berolinensis]|nr:hypothetical protein NC651_029035 [Populus alba x Populus x berolinensis]